MNQTQRNQISPNNNHPERCNYFCNRRATRLVGFGGDYYEPRCGYHTQESLEIIRID